MAFHQLIFNHFIRLWDIARWRTDPNIFVIIF